MAANNVDVEGLSEGELRELVERAQKALNRIVAKRARRTLKEARRLAAEVGFEATFAKPAKGNGRRRRRTAGTEAAAPAAKAKATGAKVAPKYRNPDNRERPVRPAN